MLKSASSLNDASLWLAILSYLGALVSAGSALISGRAASRNLRLAENQEQRRNPRLVPYLIEGYCQHKGASRFLLFSISVSNPTDTDNSVSLIELQVSYTTTTPSEGYCMAVKVPHRAALAAHLGRNANVLEPPIRVDAHQTIAGCALFEVKDALIGAGFIDDYSILVTDSQGQVSRVDQAIVRELADEKANGRDQTTRPE